ncbi:MAG: hypothetical protein HYV09_25770 [Deltaproteobacteria bacterium]|nr:hypothetical protein [Deltaproteobacteria bacterium]
MFTLIFSTVGLQVANERSASAVIVNSNIPVTPVIRTTVSLGPGTHTIRTKNLTGTVPDPVMYVWGARYSSWWYIGDGHVAWSDDSTDLNSVVTFTIPPEGFLTTYTVIVYAYSEPRAGLADIEVDGTTILTQAPFEGRRMVVPTGDFHYETAIAAAESRYTDTYIYSFSTAYGGELTAFDDDGGVGFNSRIVGDPYFKPAGMVLVGAYTQVGPWLGKVNLYANDYKSDFDGDGLGSNLEAELGLCDSTATSPACNAPQYCAELNQPIPDPELIKRCLVDRDRDGITDGWEVFGVESPMEPGNPQHLPAFGADPARKDVFVEVDYSSLATTKLQQSDVEWAANRVNPTVDVSAVMHHIGNGARLHVDTGNTCPTAPTLCGDWGGSSSVTGTNYEVLADTDMGPARRGLFRYAYASEAATGQAVLSGDRMVFGPPDAAGMNAFVHELGHSIGADHHGDDTWGAANCKPHYNSIMNYGGNWDTYSTAPNPEVFDPSRMVEDGTYVGYGFTPSHLDRVVSGYTDVYWWHFGYDPATKSVDWNLDANVSTGVLRASPVVNQAHFDCGAHIGKQQELVASAGVTDARVTRVGDRLYAFWLDMAGKLYYVHGTVAGPDAHGSCTQPNGDLLGDPTQCMLWSSPLYLAAPSSLNKSFSIAGWEQGSDKGVLVAWRGPADNLRTTYAAVDSVTGDLLSSGWTEHGVFAANPEVSVMHVNDSAGIPYKSVGMVVASGGVYVSSITATPKTGTGWSAFEPLLDNGGLSLEASTLRPAIVPWPDPNSSAGAFSGACGIFPDSSARVRLRCLDRATNRWQLVTSCFLATDGGLCLAGTYVRVSAAPNLVFHQPRKADGSPISENTGVFWAVLPIAGEEGAKVFRTLQKSSSVDPASGSIAFRPLDGVPTGPLGANMFLYEDRELSAMKGVFGSSDHGTEKLWFAPFADGTYGAQLASGNDFALFERRICVGLRARFGDAPSKCGNPFPNTL